VGIQVTDLTYAFGERVLFRDLSWTARAGTVVALMGPSGIGKSTLLALLAGHLTPASGQIHLGGTPEWIMQSAPLLERRSAIDNAAVGLLVQGIPFSEATKRARSALESFGLADVAGVRAARLSGGERQRVAVARAVMRGAAVILADEPTASLDPAARESICDSLLRAANEGASVVIATHDPAVSSRCDQVVRLGEPSP
jgi:ABC-type lipoprotein export system ATPase subunit